MYLQFAMLQGAILHCQELERQFKSRTAPECNVAAQNIHQIPHQYSCGASQFHASDGSPGARDMAQNARNMSQQLLL